MPNVIRKITERRLFGFALSVVSDTEEFMVISVRCERIGTKIDCQ